MPHWHGAAPAELLQRQKGVIFINLTDIYEKVTLAVPLEEKRFLSYTDDTVKELLILCDGFVIPDGKEYESPKDLSSELNVLPLYADAILSNIIFAATGDGNSKNEFLRKARLAYLKYWKDSSQGKRAKRMRW